MTEKYNQDHFREATKMVPLTLDQLREMDGKPVWIVEYPEWGHWELTEDAEDYIWPRHAVLYGLKGEDGRYGLAKGGWIACAYAPPQINLETYRTCELVQELRRREGVETHIAEPYQDLTVTAPGPAVVLIVID